MTPAYSQDAELSPDGKSLTVRLPLALRKRGGRKIIISPAGERLVPQPWATPRSGIDASLVKTLAQAFQWQRLLADEATALIQRMQQPPAEGTLPPGTGQGPGGGQ